MPQSEKHRLAFRFAILRRHPLRSGIGERVDWWNSRLAHSSNCNWQLDRERRSLSDTAVDADPPVVRLNNVPARCQSKTSAAFARSIRAILGRKIRVEDVSELFLWNTGSVVANHQVNGIGGCVVCQPNDNLTARWHRLSCICLLYTSPSPRDKRQSRMPSSA